MWSMPGADSRTRAELVAEALRLLDLAQDFPDEPAPGEVEGYSTEALAVLRELPRKRRPAGHVEERPVVECRPGTMGGRPVFRGTRVPVEVLFENLADSLPLGDILDAYETLDIEDCRATLLQAMQLLMGNVVN